MTAVITILFCVAVSAILWKKWIQAVRAEFIRNYRLPKGIFDSLQRKYPHWEPKDCHLVSRALRLFFLAHLKSGRKYVSMPSQAVDEVWHDFILNTRDYAKFCRGAFGRFMHHTPAVVLGSNTQSNEGLRRCWWFACVEENIDPRKPLRLPLLFSIDGKLNIPDGFKYVPDCKRVADQSGSSPFHCGGSFSDAGVDGTSDGWGDASSDGGSDGGSGCGGGD
ncbi:MAG: hypothetical protein Q8S96_16715 [Hydrogenophaga sp.]|uniref:glycine-rich domain-containing protein n=1 Tax=Comamonadaceae TaxID=80864 RepID=UPI00271C47B9|nr:MULTISPECIES: hypothetical protein [Comamonadaceae]MDO9481353.1 hypothetical protein [Hydrogenophaga sp.]MDP3346082.1 hypothetical protein [Hydrogenophaga sp.]MDP3799341.1 hypothetical protein [Polaromonas sp.]